MYSEEFVKAQLDIGNLPTTTDTDKFIDGSGTPEYSRFQYDLVADAPSFQLSWDQAYPQKASSDMHKAVQQFFNGSSTRTASSRPCRPSRPSDERLMTTQITNARPAAGPARSPGGGRRPRPRRRWAARIRLGTARRSLLRPLRDRPLIMVAVLSFMSWDGLSSPEFVGTDNWSRLIDDPVMLKSIWLTLLLTVLGVVLQTPLSILLGVWAAGHQRNRAVLSVIYFIPLLLSATAVSVLWRALLDPNFGIPASATWLFGDGNLFGEQATAIGVLAFVSTWQFTPFHTLIYQGAARAVPPVLYQARRSTGRAATGSSSTSPCRSCAPP